MKHVDNLMRQAVSDRAFPGAVLLVSKQGSIQFFKAYGMANKFSHEVMTQDTIFDLASLTKPLATTLAIMQLVDHGLISLDHELGNILPEFRNQDKSKIKIKHLLYHTSGLPDYRPYYKIIADLAVESRIESLRRLLVKEPLANPIGRQVLYSDIGFMVLRWMVEHISACRLDHFVADRIYHPLGIRDLFFVDLNSSPRSRKFAATERCPWRNTLLEGKVHDENAYAVGGIEGHAGLFGTAESIHMLLSTLLSDFHGGPSIKLFSQKIVDRFFKRLPNTDKALGFDTPSKRDSSAGRLFSSRSVGHLGFTGTSFWMDLNHRIIVILLTNRVHPERGNEAIKTFRPLVHDTVMQALT
jgi:CubicO group peptidase (beta-lactamase class C family)